MTTTATQAARVSDFTQSIGVNVHMWFLGTPYGNTANVISDLAYLGVKQVRDGLPTIYRKGDDALAAAGVKIDFIVANPNVPAAVSMLKSYAPSLLAIEGPNEVNYWPITYQGAS